MLKRWLPAPSWLRHYRQSDLLGDLSAGGTVAIMLIPQGMAYAMLAGLPPVVGLYASTIPLIIYALFGTSRQLAVGPVAVVSLLVFAGVSPLATPGTDEYMSLVLLLMLMIGVIQLLLGLLKLGFLVKFLSHAFMSAFTSAAAMIIGLSQLKHLLGVEISSSHVLLIIKESVEQIAKIHPLTLGIGLLSMMLLIFIKKYAKRLPGPLVVVVMSIVTVYTLQLSEKGVSIVGTIPSGLPTLSLPTFTLDAILSLLPIALMISFIGFMESIAMAQVIATKENYSISPNRELIGLGLANAVGSFFSAYPVTGGFSRSAVNYEAGAKTPLASIITAILMMVTLLLFTRLFYYLPHAVLAAIIMVAVYKLIDLKIVYELFHTSRAEGWTWIITFSATLFIGIEQGILIGLILSILITVIKKIYANKEDKAIKHGA